MFDIDRWLAAVLASARDEITIEQLYEISGLTKRDNDDEDLATFFREIEDDFTAANSGQHDDSAVDKENLFDVMDREALEEFVEAGFGDPIILEVELGQLEQRHYKQTITATLSWTFHAKAAEIGSNENSVLSSFKSQRHD